jgi:ribonuclease Z
VGNAFTYCTDTAYDPGNAGLARGSAVLAHEAWCTEDAPSARETHSSAREAASLARDADVERLVLIHVRPGGDDQALLAEARSVFADTTVGSDLLALGP